MSSASPTGLDSESDKFLENEIQGLEEQLAKAKARLKAGASTTSNGQAHSHIQQPPPPIPKAPLQVSTTHFLLLLADSALPLGSFAFSSGLESYLAHTRLTPFHPSSSTTPTAPFNLFLPLSIRSYATTTLPFLLAAHRDPSRLTELDDALDASIICTVGRRASTAQGRALLGIWERSFASSTSNPSALSAFATALRTPSSRYDATGLPPVSAHLAPLFGCVAEIVGLSLQQTAYVFMLGHVKALVSAAVRANLVGPFAAQKILASKGVQEMISMAVEEEWETVVEEAGQGVPTMDLWVGRHEMLYSRIFNS